LKIATVIVLAFVSDKYGRRSFVIAFAVICTLMMLIVAILGYVAKNAATKAVLITAACIWSMASQGNGGFGWVYAGEVGSQRLRARTTGLAAALSVVFGLTFNTSVPYMISTTAANWGYKTAWLFFCTGVVVVVLCVFFLPETAKRSPAELDEMYEVHRLPAWRMKGFVTEVERKGGESS
jgi:MFS family permease